MKKILLSTIFDTTCLISLIGIWPRFIEPKQLALTPIRLPIPNLPQELHNFTILQLSDLHLNPSLSDNFLNKIIDESAVLKPDLIAFTGDFLCKAEKGDTKRLSRFLNSFQAPSGCFAVLGNHDYARYISINSEGNYDWRRSEPTNFSKAINLLKNQMTLTGQMTERAKEPPFLQELIDLLDKSPFRLLHNETVQAYKGKSLLNICGLGDYMAGHFNPERAFRNYLPEHPGIVLAHNPDTIPKLRYYPGNLILCGHTHGAQINLPFFKSRLTPMEHPQYVRGLKHEDDKWLYTNRGLAGVFPFRCFSRPELTLFTLECK